MAYISAKDIETRLKEYKHSYTKYNRLHLCILHPILFYKEEFDLDVTAISKHRAKKMYHMYELMVSALSETVRRSWCKLSNIKTLENRIFIQFSKYSSLKPAFQSWLQDNVSYKYGLILEGEIMKKLTSVIDMNQIENPEDIQSYLLKGFIIRNIKTSRRDEVSLPETLEEYTSGDLVGGILNYMPRGGLFGHYWKPLSAVVGLDQGMIGKTYAMYNQLQSCLRTTLIHDVESNNTNMVSVSVDVTYTTMDKQYKSIGFLSVDKNVILEHHLMGNKIVIGKDTITGPNNIVLKNAPPEELMQIRKDITICTTRRSGVIVPVVDETVTEIKFTGYVRSNSRCLMILRDTVMKALRENEITSIVFIAGKGSGKSTLINTIKSQKIAESMFIEDSDDYGEWLTYLSLKFGQPDIINLNISHSVAIEEVKGFYIRRSKGLRYISYLNSYAESYLRIVFSKHNFAQLNDYKKIEITLTCDITGLRQYIANVNSKEGISQRFFNDGIKSFMFGEKKRVHLALLHTYIDNSKRDNQSEAIQVDFGLDSFTNVITRSQKSRVTDLAFLAEILLKRLWDDAREGSIPRVSIGGALYTLGLVPMINSDFSLSIQSDDWARCPNEVCGPHA